MDEPGLERKNVRVGLLLFGVSLLIFGGTFAIALLYLHFD
jgi:hypothetical protein